LLSRRRISAEREDSKQDKESDMYMRIIWGRIASGQWDAFEAAYKKAISLRGDVRGLKNQ